jgi:hypothetical protein
MRAPPSIGCCWQAVFQRVAARSWALCHGIELLSVICPDIAHSTAGDIANFAIG